MYDALETVQRTATDVLEQSREQLQRAGRASIEHVRRHPVQTTLIVAGVACLIAGIWWRRRSQMNGGADDHEADAMPRQAPRRRSSRSTALA